MHLRLTPVALVLLGLVISGCSSDKGLTRIDWQMGQPTMMNKTAEAGDYALYTGNSTDALVVQRLKEGQPIGFEKNDIGRIRAIAGPYSTVLDPMVVDHARWELMVKPK